jgi:hypothetical protein
MPFMTLSAKAKSSITTIGEISKSKRIGIRLLTGASIISEMFEIERNIEYTNELLLFKILAAINQLHTTSISTAQPAKNIKDFNR